TPIAPRPSHALLGASMRSTIAGLAQVCPVAVISGRDLADVQRRVGIAGIAYAGSHGFDFLSADGEAWHPPAVLAYVPALEGAVRTLGAALADVPGIELETKRF